MFSRQTPLVRHVAPIRPRDQDQVSAGVPTTFVSHGRSTHSLHLQIASAQPDFTNHSGFPANTFARVVDELRNAGFQPPLSLPAAGRATARTRSHSRLAPETTSSAARRSRLGSPLLSSLADAWDFTKKNARPGAEWIGRVVEAATPAVQVAAKVGQGIRKIGVRASAAATAFRHPDGKRGETEAKIRKAGADAQRYGGRITALANLGETALSVLGGLAGMFQADRPTQFKLRDSEEPDDVPDDAPAPDGRLLPRPPPEAPPRNHPR